MASIKGNEELIVAGVVSAIEITNLDDELRRFRRERLAGRLLGMSVEEYARLVASEETFLAIMGGSDGVMGA